MGLTSIFILVVMMTLSSALSVTLFVTFVHNPQIDKISKTIEQQGHQIDFLIKNSAAIVKEQNTIVENTNLYNASSYYVLGGICILLILAVVCVLATQNDSTNTVIDSTLKSAEHSIKANAEVSTVGVENSLDALTDLHVDVLRNVPAPNIDHEILDYLNQLPQIGGGFIL